MWKYAIVAAMSLAVGIGVTCLVALSTGWFAPDTQSKPAAHDHGHDHEAEEHVKVSPQARQNLKLRVAKVQPVKEPYWRTIRVPGQIVERPGSSERVLSSPVAGVVKHIGRIRGETVAAGEALFTIELVSEHLHSLQADLFKSTRERQLVQMEKERLQEAFKSGAIAAARMIEIDNQLKRLNVAQQARESELGARGFTKADIEQATQGKFVRHITVSAPRIESGGPTHFDYELEHVKVILGEPVQPGQPLGVLGDHHELLVEGKVFPSEASFIQNAVRDGLRVRVDFATESPSFTAEPDRELTIVNVASNVDAAAQTLGFYLRLPNQHQDYARDGKTFRLWRYRPGQRAVVQVPVEPFANVFVVPAEAIVHEGVEVYVFKDEGDVFERVKVQLLHEDTRVAILANDGSLPKDEPIALNAAVQLNWAFRAQSRKGGDDDQHDHHHH